MSPDAEAVAYSVLNPGENGPVAARLVVRQIDGTSTVQLPVPAGAAVEGIAWSDVGLVWAIDAGDQIALYRAGSDGSAVPIGAVSTTASPVASPIAPASSVASPVPVASPIASPVGQGSAEFRGSVPG
jgi:hypothetical protein